MKSLLIVLTVLLSISHSQQAGPYFPKILWAFWDTGFPGMSLFTKLCVNNMQHFSQKSGWEFRFLTNQNYTNFITEQSQIRIKNMYQNAKHVLERQNYADLVRLFLIYQNGGMWLDANSFFLGNLSWVDRLNTQPLVYNRVSKLPEILTFSLNTDMGANKTNVTDARTNQSVYLFPGVEIWSYISIPKSRFLKDTIDQIQYSLSIERYILVDQLQKQGMQFQSQIATYYITSNFEFQIVLQRKQKAIDALGSNSTQKYAVEYYRMWSIESRQSAYSIEYNNLWFPWRIVDSLIQDTLEDIIKKYKLKPYFFKFNGQFYPHLNNAIQYNAELICYGINTTVSEKSVMNVYLLKPSENLPAIQKLKNPPSDSCDKIHNYVSSIINTIAGYAAIFVAICTISLFCVTWRIRSKELEERQSNIYSSMPVEDQ